MHKQKRCEVCEQWFTPYHTRDKLCGPVCRLKRRIQRNNLKRAAHWDKYLDWSRQRADELRVQASTVRHCAICRELFSDHRKNVICCSPKCSVENTRRKGAAWQKENAEHVAERHRHRYHRLKRLREEREGSS